MAREVIVRMTDDFDRTQVADEVVKFVYEGVEYTIDLTTKNANEFREYLQPYIEAAHEAVKVTVTVKTNKAGTQQGIGRKTQMRSPVGEPSEVRQTLRDWAEQNGFDTQPRGIVKDEIRQAYTEATGIPVGSNIRLRVDEVDTSQMDQIEQQEAAASKPRKAEKPAATKAAKDPKEPNSMGVSQEMREWARENGHKLSNGYVSVELRRQFEAERHANQNGALV